MSRKLIAFLAATLMIAPLWGCGSNRDSGGGGSTVQTPTEVISTASFVGSTKCLSCHGNKANWGHTLHKAVLRAPGAFSAAQANTESFYAGTINAGLTALTTGATIYFSENAGTWSADTVTGANDKYSTTITEAGGVYTFTITDIAGTSGSKSYPVIMTYGGERNYKQRYVVTGIGASKHISPIQYNDKGTGADQWVTYHPDRWYDVTKSELTEPAASDSFDGNCAGCHFTGYQLAKNGVGEETADAVDDINGALDFDGDGSMDEINIGCEACHGAGSAHANTQNPAYIINPADLAPAEANMVCGQCHIRGKSIDRFTEFAEASATAPVQSPFPAKLDANGKLMRFRPGLDDLATFYSFDSGDGSGAGTFTSQYWGGEPSGGDFQASVKHHQQYIDMLQGPHAPDKPYDPRCFDCHDMHDNASPGRHQIVTTITEDNVVVKTANDDNSLCLTCHAGHGPFANLLVEDVAQINANSAFNDLMDPVKIAVTDHTQHYYDPAKVDGSSNGSSRCSRCHMPKTAKSALKYDIHAHTFEVIEPAASKTTAASAGIPNGCTGCHTAADDAALDALQVEFDAKFPKDPVTGALDPTLRSSNGEFIGWAATGHANYAGEPFNHWNADGAVSASCAKCHSKAGFRQYAAGATVTDAPIGQVLSCGVCHTNGEDPEFGNGNLTSTNTLWDDNAALATVTFPSGLAVSLNNGAGEAHSNMCMGCHMGRKWKGDVDNYVAGSNFGSVNPHYIAAAAVMYGTDVKGGYEYDLKTYQGLNTFTLSGMGGFNNCTSCHMSRNGKSSHQLVKPAIADCVDCHRNDKSQPGYPNVDATNFKFSGIRHPANTTDYNGNGDTTESLKNEIIALEADLLADIMTYAADPAGLNSPVVYDDASYPYWFKDTNGNGIVDPGENIFPNAYTEFDASMIRAAYNYTFSKKEPHGYIHHPDYIGELLIDSMEDLGTDIVARGYDRP